MSFPEFEFDLKVDGGAGIGVLADAVAGAILRHLGYPTEASSRFTDAIRSALSEICVCDRTCAVRFRARSGELEVIVTTGGEGIRRVVQPIPS